MKRDGRESNRATNLSPPPRLKLTDIKQNQQTTKKGKVYIIQPPLPPPPQMKKYSLLWKDWKRDFFYSLEKIIHPRPLNKKVRSSPESSPVQSRVQSRFSNWPLGTISNPRGKTKNYEKKTLTYLIYLGGLGRKGSCTSCFCYAQGINFNMCT